MEKARDDPSTEFGKKKVKNKKRGYSRSTKRQKESPVCYTDGHLSPQERRVRTRVVLRGDTERTTLERTLFLLNSDRLRPRRLPQKYWILLQDCQIVSDNHPTQHQITLK